MLTRSHSERRPLPGLSALLTHHSVSTKSDASSPPPSSALSPRSSIFAPVPDPSAPAWVTQALSSLEQGERELQSLRERQQAEVDEVNRELDNAVIDAQREERRLLEKVEQDHREAQRHLDQVKRENAAAVRVVQSLVDHHIRKMSQLKDQVRRWGTCAGGANKNQLQKGVAEIIQPWEISMSLKRVSFTPSVQAKTFSLGEVDVHEQGMTYPIGVCGVQGQKCSLHSGDATFANLTPVEIRKDLPGHRLSSEENNKSKSGNMRVVRKLRLSSSVENEEELKSPTSKSPSPRRRGTSESSQDEELESLCLDSQGQDFFLAIHPGSSQGESDVDEPICGQTIINRPSILKGQKKQMSLVMVSSEEPSCPPEEITKTNTDASTTTKTMSKGSFSSHSLMDLSPPRQTPHPRQQGTSVNKTSYVSSVDGGSPPSPADSEDSCYTYFVNTPRHGSLKQERRRCMSTADLAGKQRPLISGSIKRVNRMCLSTEGEQSQGNRSETREPKKGSPVANRNVTSSRVSRSQSMSALEGDNLVRAKEAQKPNRLRRESVVPALRELEEEGGSTALDSAYLVKQFGKQGSGRADFNLPSGVHTTAKGQLFVVDCGNARIQVTDLQKNVVQQVSPTGTERSARICNYFDVAVNAKGLIALTCAAERALLVFSRHGRLLQTFGGTVTGSTSEDLDAPRGVTVTRLDDFLVADMKRGTLSTLKLDPKTGARQERTVVTGFHRPYLVAACLSTGLMAVSERGNEAGRAPCIRVLEPGWNTIRILGVCSGLGPVLCFPWGLCIDADGDVLVADWGKQYHRVLLYPAKGVGWPLVVDNLSSPRGLALLPNGEVVVSDSMNHCVKIYRYK